MLWRKQNQGRRLGSAGGGGQAVSISNEGIEEGLNEKVVSEHKDLNEVWEADIWTFKGSVPGRRQRKCKDSEERIFLAVKTADQIRGQGQGEGF